MNYHRMCDLSLGLSESFSMEITKEKMDLFYSLTGDCSPIHVDEAYAKQRGFDGKVVYGLLSVSLFSTLAGVHLPGANCLLHGVKCKFSKPVYVGDTLTVTGSISEIHDTLGVITIKASVKNQHGKTVTRGIITAGVAQ